MPSASLPSGNRLHSSMSCLGRNHPARSCHLWFTPHFHNQQDMINNDVPTDTSTKLMFAAVFWMIKNNVLDKCYKTGTSDISFRLAELVQSIKFLSELKTSTWNWTSLKFKYRLKFNCSYFISILPEPCNTHAGQIMSDSLSSVHTHM